MRSRNVPIWMIVIASMLVLLGPLVGKSRGDFILSDDQQFTVNSFHSQGTLEDTSRVIIVPGGNVTDLYAYDYSTVDISGGSVSYRFYAYDYSTVNVDGGYVEYLFNHTSVAVCGGDINLLVTYGNGTVDMSGGSIHGILVAYGNSTVDMSGGYVKNLNALGSSSIVDISGGSVDHLFLCGSRSSDNPYGSSRVSISGGFVYDIRIQDVLNGIWSSDIVTFYGRNFSVSGGLILEGNRVLGTGMLAGEWFDGTPWTVNILNNPHTATISVVLVPLPPAVILAELALFIMDEVDTGNIDTELERSLLAKVNAALEALDRGNPNDAKVAMNDLKALINQVEAQVDKKITPEVAAEIIDRTNAIIAALAD